MGKIDKEKLLKEIKLKSDDVDVTWVVNFIKNFPEEPEQPIDFDALYSEFFNDECDGAVCSTCKYYNNDSRYNCFAEFLNSKNLTAPNPVDITMECPSCGCPSFKIEESMMCSACGTVFELTRKLEIPVKKTWTLKKHVEETFHDFGNTPYPLTSDPPENLKKYYDQHEEPDYSKIPKGSIVEIEFVSGNGNNCGYVNRITNKSISIGFHMLYNSGNSTTINFDQIESIVILKLAKE